MKMKILFFVFSCTSLFVSRAYGQNGFGFKAGMQLSKMKGFEESSNGFLSTIQAKAIGIVHISDVVTLTPSLGYSGKGYKFPDVEFTDPVGNPIGSGEATGLFNYIQLTVPISYKIAANQNQEFFFGVGPYFSYGLSAKGKLKHVAIPDAEDSWDLYSGDGYKRTDAGMVVEISTRLKKKYMIAFNLDVGLSEVSNGGNLKQLAAGLSVGYLFNQ